MKRKHRRRLARIEARLDALETGRTAWTDMPTAVHVDPDPAAPILDHRPPELTAGYFDDDDEWTGGVYL